MRFVPKQEIFALLTAALVVAVACKPPKGAGGVKSIDNFAAGSLEFHRNFCRGPYLTNAVAPELELADGAKLSREQIIEAQVTVAASLSSVPDPVRDLFFSSGGAIRLSDQIGSTCAHNLANATDLRYAGEGQATEACWDADGPTPAIYLSTAPAAISHHTVRMLGLVLSRLYADAAKAVPQSKAPAGQVLHKWGARFANDRTRLAQTFVDEIAAMRAAGDKRLSLDAFGDFLKPGNAIGRAKFEHFVFAESFDSYFCTSTGTGRDNTRETFHQLTPKTFRIFADMAKGMIQPGVPRDPGAAGVKGKAAAAPRSGGGSGLNLLGGSNWNPLNWPSNFSNSVNSMFGPANTGNDYYNTGSTAYVPPADPARSRAESDAAFKTLNDDRARIQNSVPATVAVKAATVLQPEAVHAMQAAVAQTEAAPARAQARTDAVLNGTDAQPLQAGDSQQFHDFSTQVVAPAATAYTNTVPGLIAPEVAQGVGYANRAAAVLNDPVAAAKAEAESAAKGQVVAQINNAAPGVGDAVKPVVNAAPKAADAAYKYATGSTSSEPAPPSSPQAPSDAPADGTPTADAPGPGNPPAAPPADTPPAAPPADTPPAAPPADTPPAAPPSTDVPEGPPAE